MSAERGGARSAAALLQTHYHIASNRHLEDAQTFR